MRIAILLGAVCVCWAGCGGQPPRDPAILMNDSDAVAFTAQRETATSYRLGIGDVFELSFLFERGLNTRVKVRPDGFVAVPIVGEVAAAGRSPGELDSLLTDAYATYYKEPELTVNVVEFAPPEVYVLGEVRNQRAVPLTPGMSMLAALAAAGGTTPASNLGSVVLLRRVGDGEAVARRVDLGKFLDGKGSAWDLYLAPYDIIYVPTTFIAKMERFVDSFFGGLVPIPTLYLRGWEVFNTDEVYDTFLRRTLTERETAN